MDSESEVIVAFLEVHAKTHKGTVTGAAFERAAVHVSTRPAKIQSAFFAGCDYGSEYAGDQYLGTPERQRGFDQWKKENE